MGKSEDHPPPPRLCDITGWRKSTKVAPEHKTHNDENDSADRCDQYAHALCRQNCHIYQPSWACCATMQNLASKWQKEMHETREIANTIRRT